MSPERDLSMTDDKLELYIFIDAFGWELLKRNQWFLEGLITDRKPLETVFGYSSACVPSIITGEYPAAHGYWSSFYYSPRTSPFRTAAPWLKLLPGPLAERGRIRRYISAALKKICGFSGYFNLYNVPFEYLPYFDYQEKEDIFAIDSLGGRQTVFGALREQKAPLFIETRHSDAGKIESFIKAVRHGRPGFAYLHMGELDALLHANGKTSGIVTKKLREYDNLIRTAYREAGSRYKAVELTVFSDHGMKDIEAPHDLVSEVEALGLGYGKDYIAFYDATMARFWFLNDPARNRIGSMLDRVKTGSVLSDAELKSMGAYFPDHKYGELIFLMKPGILINPSFMGRKPVFGMHGYHPSDPDSCAMIIKNGPIPAHVNKITDVLKGRGIKADSRCCAMKA